MLGVLMGGLRRKADIRDRLRVYEGLRRPRASRVRELSGQNLWIFHMLGCADCGGMDEGEGGIEAFSFGGRSGDNWADSGFCDWLFGHDVVEEAEEWREGKHKSSARWSFRFGLVRYLEDEATITIQSIVD